jgi:hypothetical protein
VSEKKGLQFPERSANIIITVIVTVYNVPRKEVAHERQALFPAAGIDL